MNINKKSALLSSFCGLMKSTVLINVTPAVKKREDRKPKRGVGEQRWEMKMTMKIKA